MRTVITPWMSPALRRLLAMRSALPHALLLFGPAGIGKSALAMRLANALLCEAPEPDGDACGRCAACGWFGQGSHPDFRRLTPGGDDEDTREKASLEIKIGQVRALGDFLSVGGHRGGRKIVVVDPADALNVPAANALLKKLEEPTGDTVFLMVTGRQDALPATIRSRCVAFALALPAQDEARRWLEATTGARAEEAEAWLAAAGGAPLRAAELAEPSQAAAYRLIIKTVAQIPDNSSIQAAEALASVPPRAWVPLLQAWVTDLGRVAAGAAPRRFPDQQERLARLARGTALPRVAQFAQWLLQQSAAVDHPLNPRLFCEDALLRYRALFG
jgi:DNA polymerase-3 subunit delta'